MKPHIWESILIAVLVRKGPRCQPWKNKSTRCTMGAGHGTGLDGRLGRPSKVLPIKSKARSIEASSKIGKSNIGCVSSSSGFLSYRGSNAHLKGAPENHGPSRMERVQASVVYLLGWKLMVWMLILSSYVEEELCGILQPHSRIKSKTNRSYRVDIPYKNFNWIILLYMIEGDYISILEPGRLFPNPRIKRSLVLWRT